MKTRTIHNEADLKKASQDILNVGGSLPVVMTLTKGTRIRTTGQNSRYWATLDEHLRTIGVLVEAVVEQTGYTPMEVRRLIAAPPIFRRSRSASCSPGSPKRSTNT